jgi:hypothetical protein
MKTARQTQQPQVGKFANLGLHTDIRPFEIVAVKSRCTIMVREMDAEQLDKAAIVPGGFCGHCTNQDTIRWNITSNPTRPVVSARLRKDGDFHSIYGAHTVHTAPVKFYDFNF